MSLGRSLDILINVPYYIIIMNLHVPPLFLLLINLDLKLQGFKSKINKDFWITLSTILSCTTYLQPTNLSPVDKFRCVKIRQANFFLNP